MIWRMLLVLGLVAALPSVALAETTCTVTEKMQCSAGSGCAKIEPKIVIRLDRAAGTYSRCDAKGCDDYRAQFFDSGVFVNIALPERGVLAKMSVDGSIFTEVVTLTGVVLLSFGSCN